MPNWVVGGVGTFVLSLIVAYWFLKLRCRGIGPPFGPHARYWALFIVVTTALVSAGIGLLIIAASHNTGAAYAVIIVPGGLRLSRLPPQRDRDMLPRVLSAVATLPFSRLYERMGEDMQDWCDTRLAAAAAEPQWIADAVTYYHRQVARQVKDPRAGAALDRWRASITHKIGIVNLIDSDADPARVWAALQLDPSTRSRKYSDSDLPRLARRLESEALNELQLFLARVYQLGHHKLLIYPFRPTAEQVRALRAEPMSPDL
ncbi:MAG TPA: hypothetical protein VME19_08375 [Streptosporangiaceae bacterium]|nr:hypothetical protein [Streptosporangiaceae bacterium]